MTFRLPLGRLPLGRLPLGRLPLGRLPLGRLPLGRLSTWRGARVCAAAALAGVIAAATIPASPAAPAEPATKAKSAPAGAIAIDADQSIEWQRQARLVIARGNAQAVRGTTQLNAQVLTAHYRERPDGSTEVWQIDAEGDVQLKNPDQTATGQRGTFNLDKNLMTLSGGQEVTVTTATSRITARKEITYDTQTRKLVARGDAVATDQDRTVYGDVITIFMRDKPAEGQSKMLRLEAEGNVRVVSGDDDIRGDRGTYEPDSGKATMTGSVKIIRGQNVITGCRGESNLKTGISNLYPCADSRSSTSRVQGVILPDATKKQ